MLSVLTSINFTLKLNFVRNGARRERAPARSLEGATNVT